MKKIKYLAPRQVAFVMETLTKKPMLEFQIEVVIGEVEVTLRHPILNGFNLYKSIC